MSKVHHITTKNNHIDESDFISFIKILKFIVKDNTSVVTMGIDGDGLFTLLHDNHTCTLDYNDKINLTSSNSIHFDYQLNFKNLNVNKKLFEMFKVTTEETKLGFKEHNERE